MIFGNLDVGQTFKLEGVHDTIFRKIFIRDSDVSALYLTEFPGTKGYVDFNAKVDIVNFNKEMKFKDLYVGQRFLPKEFFSLVVGVYKKTKSVVVDRGGFTLDFNSILDEYYVSEKHYCFFGDNTVVLVLRDDISPDAAEDADSEEAEDSDRERNDNEAVVGDKFVKCPICGGSLKPTVTLNALWPSREL